MLLKQNFNVSEKIGKEVTQLGKLLAFFYNLSSLNLGYHSVKSLRVKQIPKRNKVGGVGVGVGGGGEDE